MKYQLKQKDHGYYKEMQKNLIMLKLLRKLGWRLRIRKATTIPSRTIQTINYNLKQSSSERAKQLKQVVR